MNECFSCVEEDVGVIIFLGDLFFVVEVGVVEVVVVLYVRCLFNFFFVMSENLFKFLMFGVIGVVVFKVLFFKYFCVVVVGVKDVCYCDFVCM